MSLALFSVVSGAKWTTKMLQSVCLQFCPGRSVNWLDYYTFRSFTASINCCKKHSTETITQLRSLELLTTKTPLLHMLYYMNWLTRDFWTRTGGWEFDCSHGAGTSSPSHWQQVEEQAPKPVGWMICFLLMTFVPVRKLCVYIYMYAFSIWVLL